MVLLEEAEKYPGTPKITTHAANLQRPGTVGDRLYEQWLERQERDKHGDISFMNSLMKRNKCVLEYKYKTNDLLTVVV